MTLAADTWRIGSNETTGLLHGPGTPYEVVFYRIGFPPVAPHDQQKLGGGVVAARDVLGGRQVALSVEVEADSNTAAVNVGSLLDAWVNTNTDIRLYWRLLGQTGSRYLIGRPRPSGDVMWDQAADSGIIKVELDFFSPDGTIRLTSGDTAVNF